MASDPEIAELRLYLHPALRAAAERAAADDQRSLASLVAALLVEHLRVRGYLPPLHPDEGMPSDQLTSENDV